MLAENLWTSLHNPDVRTCSDSACDGKLKWHDGTPFNYISAYSGHEIMGKGSSSYGCQIVRGSSASRAGEVRYSTCAGGGGGGGSKYSGPAEYRALCTVPPGNLITTLSSQEFADKHNS